MKVQVTVVPVIMSPVTKFPIDPSKLPILNTIVLAEPLSTSPEQVELDILIGLDHYFSIVLKDRIDLTTKLAFRLGYSLRLGSRWFNRERRSVIKHHESGLRVACRDGALISKFGSPYAVNQVPMDIQCHWHS